MRTLLIILITLTLSKCKGQDKNKQISKPKQEKNMKTFDIKTFEKNKQNTNQYFFTKEDGTIVKQYSGSSYYRETIKSKDSLFEMYYEYNDKGRIEKILKFFPNDFVIGIMKEYDEQGNLIKETNLDKPFTYTWKDVKKYLKQHGVKDFEKDIIAIQRFDNPDEIIWRLGFHGKYKNIKGQFHITLDGKTGEELEVKLFKGKKALGEDGTIADYEIIYKKK